MKDQLRELFHSQMKYSPVIAKLGFVLAKHAMIKSNEVKVQMIDKYIFIKYMIEELIVWI